jgi:ubiquinone biosynthesis protein UbiJ
MTIAAKSFIAVVNHLLARETWARDRLIPYAGKTARLSLPGMALALGVTAEGLLVTPGAAPANSDARVPGEAAAGQAPAGARDEAALVFDVTIAVPAAALSAFAGGGQAAVMKHVRIEGDAEFAATIAKLAEHLRWDAEEDLARVIGDAPAYRAASIARGIADQARRTGLNLIQSVSEYLLDENPQLVRRGELDGFAADLARVRDTLARVEKRIERIEAKTYTDGHPAGDMH